MNWLKTGFVCFCAIYLDAGFATEQQRAVNDLEDFQRSQKKAQTHGPLRIVTWNVEHLAFPMDRGCKPRKNSDIKAMRHYAEKIDADIVALQEVESEQAVRQIFPESEWQIVLSERPDSEAYECRGTGYTSTQQKVAFALRKSIEILAIDQNSGIALNSPGLRYALGVTVNTIEGPMEMLNLHLKSGCFVDDFRRKDSEACQVFSQQAPLLDQWIEQREKNNTPYVILGDFNHRISAPYNRLAQMISNNSTGTPSTLQIATQQLIGCHPRYPAPIDHIVVGGKKLNKTISDPSVHHYDSMKEDTMLSDHCAVSVDLFKQREPLSTAVKWQTRSKEYQLLTRAIYHNAGEALKKKTLPDEPWVVVMDLDETVLDNSAYQVNLDKTGRTYSPNTWGKWVTSERAVLVPGAREFIDLVLSLGGKLALVTNRNKQHDKHTWRNLVALGLPINIENACLMGRSKTDSVIDKPNQIINDKDLRRQQINTGKADCYSPNKKHANWQKPHQIVFQVGDNIEDIGGVTQEDANPAELLKRWADDVIILPNPMYGSWR